MQTSTGCWRHPTPTQRRLLVWAKNMAVSKGVLKKKKQIQIRGGGKDLLWLPQVPQLHPWHTEMRVSCSSSPSACCCCAGKSKRVSRHFCNLYVFLPGLCIFRCSYGPTAIFLFCSLGRCLDLNLAAGAACFRTFQVSDKAKIQTFGLISSFIFFKKNNQVHDRHDLHRRLCPRAHLPLPGGHLHLGLQGRTTKRYTQRKKRTTKAPAGRRRR